MSIKSAKAKRQQQSTTTKPKSSPGLILAARKRKSSGLSSTATASSDQAAQRGEASRRGETDRRPRLLSRSSTTGRGSSNGSTSKGSLAKLKARRSTAHIGQSGIGLGDRVVCTWPYGPGYGSAGGRFKGKVVDIRGDDGEFFTLQDKQGVILDMYLPMCTELRKL